MSRYDVAIVVSRESLPPVEDDRLLYDECVKLGLQTGFVPWDDETFDWSGTAAAVLRSTWDYADRPREFALWLDKVKEMTVLWNDPALVADNADKRYLQRLNDIGIPTVPTVYCRTVEETVRAAEETDAPDVVLKPSCSAAGRRTYRLRRDDRAALLHSAAEIAAGSTVMVQPFLPEIKEEGEISAIFIDGAFTHFIRKRPSADGFMVQPAHGGTEGLTDVVGWEELQFCRNVIRQIGGGRLLFARVDYVLVRRSPVLMELELIEPDLFLRFSRSAAKRLAAALARRVGRLQG